MAAPRSAPRHPPSGASNNHGLSNFKLGEFAEIIFRDLACCSVPGSTSSASPWKKLSNITPTALSHWRPKYCRTQTGTLPPLASPASGHNSEHQNAQLEMDFVLQGRPKILHVLNARLARVTCSLSFAKYVCDKMENVQKGGA